MKYMPGAANRRAIRLLILTQTLFTVVTAQAETTNCISPPPSLISWWPGNDTATDIADGNNGTLVGNATYGSGKVAQAFVFDGDQDGVVVGTAVNLQLQDFTIETWIKRTSASVISFNGNGGGMIFSIGGGGGGYGFYLGTDSVLAFGKLQVNAVSANASITDTNWHHVALTKSGTTVVFYVDGVAYFAPAYNSGGFTYTAPGYIGAWLNPSLAMDNSFYGMIDDLAIYGRGLSAAEVQAIYQAGSQGKCSAPAAPVIIVQPTDQTAFLTNVATFSVVALGTEPLTYQWAFGNTNIPGATNSTLPLANLQFTNAGVYSVVVTNPLGSATSSNATLTVLPIPPCAPAPPGLVSWWRGESNALDSLGGNHGTMVGNTAYGSGRVDKAFTFDGSGDAVNVGNPASLQLQNFTIEAWIKRANVSTVSLSPNPNDSGLVAYGNGGYGLGMYGNGNLYLTRTSVDAVSSVTGITNTDWHHVAVTKTNSTVVFYVDGIAYPAPAYNSAFTFSANLAIGANGNFAYSFLGSIDEVAIYDHSLAEAEIQAIYNANLSGKCPVLAAPFIVTHPRNTNAIAGTNVTLNVVAGGSLPLSYQWRFNGTNLANATNSTLTLTNLKVGQTGNYSVGVTNTVSGVISSNALLTVNFPVAVLRAGITNTMAGRQLVVPITLAANGNENSLGFSLNFSTQRLAFASAALGSGATGATLLVNTSLIATGRLGVVLAFPPQSNFAPGTQEVARVTFNSLPLLGAASTTATNAFADQPVLRELSDAQLQTLAANYSNGTVTLAPTIFEGDVSPRTNGNQNLSTTDWLQVGRFVARLDTPTPVTNEFQRADCAPRATLGDGQLKVTDWVQAGRYLAGYDPLAAVGGPTAETSPTFAGPSANRQLRVANSSIPQAQGVNISVNLEAQGDENAVGFTLAFDPAAFTFASVTAGSGAAGANFTPNTSQVGSGKVGVVLALPTGSTFSAGTRELVSVNLTAVPSATGVFPVALNDQLATRCIADVQAGELAVTYLNGTVTVISTNPAPSLTIAQANTNVVISWPAWAGDFALEMADTLGETPEAWTNAPGPLQTNGGNILSTLPLTNQTKFFRLHR